MFSVPRRRKKGKEEETSDRNGGKEELRRAERGKFLEKKCSELQIFVSFGKREIYSLPDREAEIPLSGEEGTECTKEAFAMCHLCLEGPVSPPKLDSRLVAARKIV